LTGRTLTPTAWSSGAASAKQDASAAVNEYSAGATGIGSAHSSGPRREGEGGEPHIAGDSCFLSERWRSRPTLAAALPLFSRHPQVAAACVQPGLLCFGRFPGQHRHAGSCQKALSAAPLRELRSTLSDAPFSASLGHPFDLTFIIVMMYRQPMVAPVLIIKGFPADTWSVYRAYRDAREAGPLTEEQVFLTRERPPQPLPPGLTWLRTLLHPTTHSLSKPRPVGTFGMRYVQALKDTGDRRTLEALFWKSVLADLMQEQPLPRSMTGRGGLRDLVESTMWFPPAWSRTAVNKRRMVLEALCAVLPPHVERGIAYWSLHLAASAQRLKRCRRCGNIFLARHPGAVDCGCPRLPRGRPRRLPRQFGEAWRQLQNRLSQWTARGRISRAEAQLLRTAMTTDREAVEADRLKPADCVRRWTEALADPQAASGSAASLKREKRVSQTEGSQS